METQLNLADIVPSRSFFDSVLTLKSSIVAGALPLLCPGNALSLAEELLSKKKKKKTPHHQLVCVLFCRANVLLLFSLMLYCFFSIAQACWEC